MAGLFRTLAAGLFAVAVPLMWGQAVHAQSSLPPFQCTGDILQVQSGQLRIFDPISSTYTDIGSNQGSYNATGFNVQDNFGYGSQANFIIRIGADGSTERVFNIGRSSFSGDVDFSNNYYLRLNNRTYTRFDLATGAAENVSFSGSNRGVADVAYLQGGGQEFLIGFSGGFMVRYNITTGVKTDLPVSGGLPSGSFGASWTDVNGRLFTFNNGTGEIFEIFGFLGSSPSTVFVAQADPSGNNDGFSCAAGPFPNLPPLAFDDDFTTPVNVAVTQNVISDNGNGMDNDPEGLGVTVNTTPVVPPNNGIVVLNADGSFTYTPDLNFIGIDTFVYEIIDVTGLTAQATVTITIDGTIDFDLTKSLPAGPASVTTAGQVLTFEVQIVNTGDIPLTDVVAQDTAPDGTVVTLSNPVETGGSPNVPGQLDVGETFTFSYDFVVTQDDIDSGVPLVNTVTATANETGDDEKQDGTSTPILQTPNFTLDKTVDVNTLSAPGLLTYRIEVVNTGNVTLTDATLTDTPTQGANTLTLTSGPDLTGDDNNNGDLDVGETFVFAATFEATQGEIDEAGDIVNTASFTTTEAGSATADATTVVVDTPLVAFSKVATIGTLSAPGLITYVITAENTGNVSLTGVNLTDVLTQGGAGRTLTSGPSLSGDLDADGEIDVGETFVYAATFQATQDEIDDGDDILNSATLATNELPDQTGDAITTITQSPSFTLDKTVDQDTIDATGSLRYEIAVVNTGNVTLTGIDFQDTITQNAVTLPPATGPTLMGDINGDGNLDVGESFLYVITLDVVQSQIDDGADIINDVSFNPAEAAVQTDQVRTMITQLDALALIKTVAAGEPTSFSAVDDTINFTFVVENTGNTTRPGPILIDDDQIPGVLECQPGDLAPMGTVTCTFPWTAQQSDLDAGSVTNIATAIDDEGLQSDPQQVTVTAVQTPAISIVKDLDDDIPLPNFQTGETLNYEFLVTNTGNVTLATPIDVTDPLVTNVLCAAVPAGGLMPGESFSCTGTHVITLAEVQVGSITNVATVSASFDGAAVEDQDDALFPVDAAPKLDLVKATDPTDTSFSAAGDFITYTYTVTNQVPDGGSSGVAITQPIIIIDDRLSETLTCFEPTTADPSLQVNESITCSAQYQVTQADVDAELVTNIATANTTITAVDEFGNSSTAQVISPPEMVTVTADLTPSIALEKVVDTGAPTPAAVGDTIPFTITATNNGEQTLSNVMITDPQLGALTCDLATPVTLAPTDTLVCRGSFTVTQDAIDTQTVGDNGTAVFTNTASVAANDPFGVALDPVTDDADHPLDPANPALEILKELIPAADPAFTSVGEVLQFRMTVTNTGNTTINEIEVTDSLVAGVCPIGTLAPDAFDLTCLFEYVVTQADIDIGEVLNTGTVTGRPANPDAEPVGATDDLISVGPDFLPSLDVIKGGTLDLGADGVASVSDVISYQITVANTGNVTITNTVVTDPLVGPITYAAADDADNNGNIDTLAPGDSATVTATFSLTQDDINLGTVTNTASAEGFDPNNDPVSDTSDSADPNDGAGGDDPTVTTISRGPALSVDKTVSDSTDVEAGDILTYSYVVRNTGNVTLTDVTLVDQHTSASGKAPLVLSPNNGVVATLVPGDEATFSATFTVTQEDIDLGEDLTNIVTATSTSPDGTTAPMATDNEVVDLDDRLPGINVEKTATPDANVTVGTVVTYTFDVENTGNVTLTDVTLVDQQTSSAGTSPLTISPNDGVLDTLQPGATATLSAIFTVTQADIDDGNDLTNIVTVTTQSPAGTVPPTDTAEAAVDLDDSAPSIEAIKTVQSVEGFDVGNEVVFEIIITNTGNVTLSDVVLTDTLTRADGTPITPVPPVVWDMIDDGAAGVLDVGEDWVYTLTFALTQADIDAGGITNSVLVQANDPDGTAVADVSDFGAGDGNDPTPVLIPASPSLETVKMITSTTTELGGTVRFSITVENTGNVTLSDVAIASDDLTRNDAEATPLTLIGPSFAGASLGSSPGTLQVGEIATFNASYVLTQDDIDAGGITNTATAIGTPPIGTPVLDVSDDNGAGDNPTVLAIAPVPSFLFDKRLAAVSDPSFNSFGEILSFEFEITNTGNITLTPPFQIDDPLITDAGGTVTCPTDNILPDASVICSGNFETTQADVDAGGITNVATATIGDAEPVTDTTLVPAIQMPALELVKSAPSIDPQDFQTGLVVTYTFVSTNIGNTTLTDPITLSDALFDPSDFICAPFPADGLAPDATYTCTADYTITTEDVELAVVVNNATASSNALDSNVSSVTIPNNGVPALTLEKSIIRANQPDGSDSGTLTFDEVGDQLVYQFDVTNSGNVAFARDVEIFDTLFDTAIACFVTTDADPELAGGEQASCTGTYTVTQADVDEGAVLNEAFARTEFGNIPTVVLSAPDDVTVTANTNPGLTIEKAVDALTYGAVGDVLTYDITVTNTGNQTLANVAVTDPLLPTLSCEAPVLAVDDVLACAGSFTVTQTDIDNGSVTNVATATGVGPSGEPITPQQDTVTSTGPVEAPTLALEKIATPNPFGSVGSDVTFIFAVANTSIFTISDIIVTDDLPDGSGTFTCEVGTLAPGDISEDCTFSSTITQADVDAGEIVNTATASGTAPGDVLVTVDDTVIVPGPTQAPSIELTKIADVPGTFVGAVISYTFTVENTGNVSLTNIGIGDDLERNDGEVLELTTPVTLQMSAGVASGDLDSDSALDPDEVFTFVATYEITQDDVNAGGFSNTATVFAEPPGPGVVFDTSDDGNDSDGNTVDDPTVVSITTAPVLDVEKVISQPAGAVGETVIFEIRAANRGNVDLTDVVPTDTLTRSDGTDLSGDVTGPTRTSNETDDGDDTLNPGEVFTFEVSYTLTQDDINAGSISNTATVAALDPDDNQILDVSDNGMNSDGNILDDPTILIFPPLAQLDVTKTLASIGTDVGDEAVFTILAVNTGNVTLSGVSLDDTMTNGDGTVLAPLDITVSGLTDGDLLPLETATYNVTYVLTQEDIDSGSVTNTATVNATSPTGGPVFDVSDDGDDQDGNTADDPTVATIVQTPSIELIKTVSEVQDTNESGTFGDEGDIVIFEFTVANTGNVSLANVVVDDTGLDILTGDSVLLPDPDFDGILSVGEGLITPVLAATATYELAEADLIAGQIENSATASATAVAIGVDGTPDPNLPLTGVDPVEDTSDAGSEPDFDVTTGEVSLIDDPAADGADDPTVLMLPALVDGDLFITKSTPLDTVLLGTSVPYTITLRTDSLTSVTVNVVDTLPAGFLYTPESGMIDGVPDDVPIEPSVSGRTLTFSNVSVPPGPGITLRLVARVGTDVGVGSHTNRVRAFDPDTGAPLSEEATATVERVPEAVFDCSDIIGKVFDDRNFDGYQNGADRSALSDQSFDGSKDQVAGAVDDGHEPGLPNVRLVTATGTIITTDEHGRYSVPCAEMPGIFGTNFTLKLDERSLPSGYRVTTENPRTMRVTAGIFTEMNFGAAIGRVIDIDLTAAAFTANNQPVDRLEQGLVRVLQQVASDPSILRISYFSAGESRADITARLNELEEFIDARWRGIGDYRLIVERDVKYLQ